MLLCVARFLTRAVLHFIFTLPHWDYFSDEITSAPANDPECMWLETTKTEKKVRESKTKHFPLTHHCSICETHVRALHDLQVQVLGSFQHTLRHIPAKQNHWHHSLTPETTPKPHPSWPISRLQDCLHSKTQTNWRRWADRTNRALWTCSTLQLTFQMKFWRMSGFLFYMSRMQFQFYSLKCSQIFF